MSSVSSKTQFKLLSQSPSSNMVSRFQITTAPTIRYTDPAHVVVNDSTKRVFSNELTRRVLSVG